MSLSKDHLLLISQERESPCTLHYISNYMIKAELPKRMEAEYRHDLCSLSSPLITIPYADRSQCLTVDGGRPWNQSWYMWDVEPYQDNFTGTPSRQTFQEENDGV